MHPLLSRSLILRLAAMLLLMGGLSACAVKTNSRGGLVYGVDTAALFGTEIGQFPLQDGGLGTLRREGKNFSVKLSGNQRVVPLNNVDSARIARTENVGPRTVVVIETQRRNCDYRYTVLAIEGSDVLSWDLGNCRDRPAVLVQDDRSAMTFDFPKGSRIERFVYTQDGRMRRGDVKTVAGLNPRANPFADESLYPPGYLESLRLHGVFPPPAAPAAKAGKPGKSGKSATPARPAAPDAPARTPPADNPAGQSQSAGRVIPPPPQRVPGGDGPAPAASTAPRAGGASRVPAKLDLPDEEITSTRLDLRD
ncbi:hypothetical protein [Achromobacter sp. UMC46]|uniref:hypothetical protein n=1 Tax=Achromobacter sp. UMC46 TaxID=1862319 RepID=UPI0016014F65|nr:hypothetical protein [Achromobacter sp. UMC46]MBB1596486.1 hypothetical protein [Achromobacter sp. UMC46]